MDLIIQGLLLLLRRVLVRTLKPNCKIGTRDVAPQAKENQGVQDESQERSNKHEKVIQHYSL
jgi:hypothetical protein